MELSPRATSFGQVAEEYHRWRPSYPAEAVAWLAPPSPARVAELGAGTGKLTELLIARGLVVEAVEPDPRMLEVLRRNNPTAVPHRSDASGIPVADGSVDAVLAADSFHWFDPEVTRPEIRRVLKPGGWLGLVWNVVAEPVEPWEIALTTDSDDYNRKSKGSAAPLKERLGVAADEIEARQFEWAWELTPEHWAAFMATTSMAIAMPPMERAEAFERSRVALQRVCVERGRASMPMRHVASCFRWTPSA